ncbi:hypothetical protein N2152v2_007345 [Parachlorella kessleri]
MTKKQVEAPLVLPKLIALDLDATLWWPEMYLLQEGPPFWADKKAGVVYSGRAREEVRLMGDSREILNTLATDERWAGTQIAYVSRTEYPEWADQCLQLFELECGTNLHTLGVHHEIYPGSKRTHFREIHARSGIDYHDCLFFDNERWNCTDVAPMGVCCVYCPDGLTMAAWEMGLRLFAQHQAKRKAGSSGSSRQQK